MMAARYLGVSYYDVRSWVPYEDKAKALVAWNADEYGHSVVESKRNGKI